MGEIHPSGILFISIGVGSAEIEGVTYNMDYAAMGERMPLVYCKQTGKTFSLSWEEIVDLAIKAGVSEA